VLTVTSNEMRAMVGQTIGPSEWIDLTQDMIDTYADAVHDHNWIHVDVPRATAAFGGTIAHGLLPLSLAPLARSSAPEVAEYARKVADRDHWLAGMCRLQARMS
jgi:acyl dehydratase